MKRCLTSLVQIKTTVRYHYTARGVAKMKSMKERYELLMIVWSKRNVTHCWGKCNLVQPLQQMQPQFSKMEYMHTSTTQQFHFQVYPQQSHTQCQEKNSDTSEHTIRFYLFKEQNLMQLSIRILAALGREEGMTERGQRRYPGPNYPGGFQTVKISFMMCTLLYFYYNSIEF